MISRSAADKLGKRLRDSDAPSDGLLGKRMVAIATIRFPK